MKERLYETILDLMVFWIVTGLFSGIIVNEGVLGYIICGGIFGIALTFIIPLIKFFTLPVKAVTVISVSVMISVIVFFVYNFALPFIDFSDGALEGLSNMYFEFPELTLSMIGNVLVGGFSTGIISALIRLLRLNVEAA